MNLLPLSRTRFPRHTSRVVIVAAFVLVLAATGKAQQTDPAAAKGKRSISQWAFETVPTLSRVVVDPKEVPQPFVTGKFGFTVAYAPDYVGADIERRFYIELQEDAESATSLPKLEVKTSDSIDGTDKSQTGGRMTGGARRRISTILARIGVSD